MSIDVEISQVFLLSHQVGSLDTVFYTYIYTVHFTDAIPTTNVQQVVFVVKRNADKAIHQPSSLIVPESSPVCGDRDGPRSNGVSVVRCP